MSELGEIIALAVPHSEEEPECPFCPEEPPTEFTTYPGAKNNSDTLAKNMETPGGFPHGGESGVRPKDAPMDPTALVKPDITHSDEGAYSSEAHHLVSGKQALGKSDKHKFERWICADEKIISDTGYSVNNYDNGIWMPSVPEKYNVKPDKGKWGSLPTKKAVAENAMQLTGRQFHKSHHSIKDKKDDDQVHQTYDSFLVTKLEQMDERMEGWASACPICKDENDNQKDKVQPTFKANRALDRLARVAQRHITGDRATWDIFISRLALNYHNPVCPHTTTEA